jgi:hypothetical protein
VKTPIKKTVRRFFRQLPSDAKAVNKIYKVWSLGHASCVWDRANIPHYPKVGYLFWVYPAYVQEKAKSEQTIGYDLYSNLIYNNVLSYLYLILFPKEGPTLAIPSPNYLHPEVA